MSYLSKANLEYKERLGQVVLDDKEFPEYIFKEPFELFFIVDETVLDLDDLILSLCSITHEVFKEDVYFSFGRLNDTEYKQYQINTENKTLMNKGINFLMSERWEIFGEQPLLISNLGIDWLISEGTSNNYGVLAFKNRDIYKLFSQKIESFVLLDLEKASLLSEETLNYDPQVRQFITNYSKD